MQYFILIRDAFEKYRLLFIAWVNTFDSWNYVVDGCGLFNLPGIAPGVWWQETQRRCKVLRLYISANTPELEVNTG